MSAPEPSPLSAGLHSAARDRLETVVTQFEDAWRRGERPTLDDYLAAARDEHRALLVELAHADLHYRLLAGEPAQAEDYLGRYSELASDRPAVLDLVVAEYEGRCELQSGVGPEEYRRRFPHLGEELSARLQAAGRRAITANQDHFARVWLLPEP
jgi:hypothetical protein